MKKMIALAFLLVAAMTQAMEPNLLPTASGQQPANSSTMAHDITQLKKTSDAYCDQQYHRGTAVILVGGAALLSYLARLLSPEQVIYGLFFVLIFHGYDLRTLRDPKKLIRCIEELKKKYCREAHAE